MKCNVSLFCIMCSIISLITTATGGGGPILITTATGGGGPNAENDDGYARSKVGPNPITGGMPTKLCYLVGISFLHSYIMLLSLLTAFVRCGTYNTNYETETSCLLGRQSLKYKYYRSNLLAEWRSLNARNNNYQSMPLFCSLFYTFWLKRRMCIGKLAYA